MKTTSALSAFALGLCALTGTANAAPGEQSFTPQSLLSPLFAVTLESSTGGPGAMLYLCPTEADGERPMDGGVPSDSPDASAGRADASVGGSDAGVSEQAAPSCLVDMADPTALAALFHGASIEVPAGAYDKIRIHHCGRGGGSSGYTTFVRGSIVLDGTTYYTTTGLGRVLTSDVHEARAVDLEHSGCASDIALPEPVMVAEGGSLNISAFFSLRNITWATLTGNGPPGGCHFSADHTQSVCTAYPIPIAYIGATSPTIDTYYITEDLTDLTASKAGGQILLIKDALGHAFGGFARRLFSPTSVQPSVNYDTPLKSVSPTAAAGVYQLETYGSSATSRDIVFPAFSLMSHEGTLDRVQSAQGLLPYRAVLQ